MHVTKAKAALTVAIAITESDLAQARIDLTKTMGAVPYKVEDQIEAEDNVAQLEKDIARAKAILETQF